MKRKRVAVSVLAVALWLLLALFACSPQEQRLVQTEVAKSAGTAIVVAQTQAAAGVQTGVVAAQTQVVNAIQTGAAEAQTRAIPLQTQVAQAAQTTLADQVQRAETQAASFQQTALAELTRLAPGPGGAAIHYFALGDSIASGHGLDHDITEPCFRSRNSYPNQVVRLLKSHFQEIRYTILACSGATVAKPPPDKLNCDGCRFKWFRNQMDETLKQLPDDHPVLVTINIGTNDFGWTDVPSMLPHIVENADVYLAWVNEAADSVAQELRAQIPRLLAHENVYVVITDVYNPFNQTSFIFDVGLQRCNKIIGQLNCYERTKYGVDGLNNAYVLDVFVPLGRPSRLRVTNINPKFYRHESPRPKCGDSAPDVSDTWIQYPGQPGVNGEVPLLLQVITKEKHGDCFHPNEKGAQAYADAVMGQFLRMRR